MKIITTAKAYTKFESTPMQVDVQLAKPAAFYHMPELDGLLARVVVDEATRGRGLPDSAEPYFIPLPLEKLWTCPTTFAPLWNATRFFPLEKNTARTLYWHKRGYGPELLNRQRSGKPHNADFRKGRHKEYRMPLPMQSCLRWRAYAVGDIDEVERLLSQVRSLGKKRVQGHGIVLSWEASPVSSFSYAHDGRLIKAFPVAYPNLPKMTLPKDVDFNIYETGWTPPYWLATLFKTCLI